jgi:hypothetical protein
VSTGSAIVAGIQAPGPFNAVVSSEDEARSLLQLAMPDAVELPPAIAGKPYPQAPAGCKKWYQLHPPEPWVGHHRPHFKYEDWTRGKKRTGGSWGHIEF